MAGQSVQIIHLEMDLETLEVDYRFLVDSRHIKYVTIVGKGFLSGSDMCFAPVLLPSLPPFLPGPWNVGTIAANELGKGVFQETRQVELPGIESAWHSLKVDILDLNIPDATKMRSNLWKVTVPSQDNRTAVAKMANGEWEIGYYNNETLANSWIRELDIAPQFRGHIVEEGRIVGFLVDFIEGGRVAGMDDLAACQALLERVHEAGIKHGDVNRHNFVITNERAWLVDWENAERCTVKAELDAEFESLERSLVDKSGKGGGRYDVPTETY